MHGLLQPHCIQIICGCCVVTLVEEVDTMIFAEMELGRKIIQSYLLLQCSPKKPAIRVAMVSCFSGWDRAISSSKKHPVRAVKLASPWARESRWVISGHSRDKSKHPHRPHKSVESPGIPATTHRHDRPG